MNRLNKRENMNILFATANIHKKKELSAIIGGAAMPDEDGVTGGFRLLIPADADLDFDPEETGNSFHENALLKARELYSLLQERRPSLYSPADAIIADDSGLCVDALGGRPGIYSARYAGAGVSHSEKKLEAHERNALLLEELGSRPARSARFVCAMVLLFSPERFFLAQETMEGEIVKGPEFIRGTGGFGYDPVFFLPELGLTVAELPDAEKNRISHRGKAARQIAAILVSSE